MVESIRQSAEEDDETFLLRAERVMEMEEAQIRECARGLLAAAVRTFDKPDAVASGQDGLRQMLSGPSPYISRRACLLARAMCREMQAASTGPDPVAESVYQALSPTLNRGAESRGPTELLMCRTRTGRRGSGRLAKEQRLRNEQYVLVDRVSLRAALDREGIAPSSYSLGGDDPEDRYVLAIRPGGWAFSSASVDGRSTEPSSRRRTRRVAISC